jgi:hypothetical protein
MSVRRKIISKEMRKSVKKAAVAPRAVRRQVAKRAGTRATVTLQDVAGEIGALRAAIERNLQAAGSDLAQEGEVAAVRRVLGDLMESRVESILRRLVAVRVLAAARGGAAAPALLAAIDPLIMELGGLRFDAPALDFFDPLIHRIVGERRDDARPDGIVLEMVQPGWRTARGALLEKAAVTVNRRS